MQCYECNREGEDTAAWVGIVDRPERFCCLECGRAFVERLSLPIVLGVGTWFVDQVGLFPEVAPEESPLKIAILGVQTQPGGPEPLHITTREEYLAAYPGSSPPRELFDIEPVMVIEMQEAPAPPTALYVGDGYARIATKAQATPCPEPGGCVGCRRGMTCVGIVRVSR